MQDSISFLQQSEADLKGQRQIATLNEIEANFDNIRAAWSQAAKRRNFAAIDAMIDGIYRFTLMRGRFQEGTELFQLAQTQLAPQSGEQPHRAWGRVLARYADLPEIEQALAIAEKIGDQSEIAFCLSASANVATGNQDHTRAIALYENALVRYQALNDKFGTANALFNLATAWGSIAQIEKMGRFTYQSLALQREIGNGLGEAECLTNLGSIAVATGDFDAAEQYGRDALRIYRSIGTQWRIGDGITSLAVALPAILKGNADIEEIRQLVEEALAIAREYKYGANIGRSLLVLGLIALREEDYERARQLTTEGQTNAPSDPHQLILGNMNLAYIECGLGHYEAAKQHLRLTLEMTTMFDLIELTKRSVAGMALIANHEGRREQAVELLPVAFAHPTSAAIGQRKLPLFRRIQTDLKAELGEEIYTAAWKRGQQLDAKTVAEEFLKS